jgi:hypothetical protein
MGKNLKLIGNGKKKLKLSKTQTIMHRTKQHTLTLINVPHEQHPHNCHQMIYTS